MISVIIHGARVAIEVRPKMLHSPHNSQTLQFCDTVVLLMRLKTATGIGGPVEVSPSDLTKTEGMSKDSLGDCTAQLWDVWSPQA